MARSTGRGSRMNGSRRWALCLLTAAVLASSWARQAQAESPQEFAQQLNKTKGVSAVVNLRESGSLGAIAIALSPQLVGDRPALETLLERIGRFAAAQRMRATVVTPNQADNDFVAEKIKVAGVSNVTTRIMAEDVSIKTSRIFLSPAP